MNREIKFRAWEKESKVWVTDKVCLFDDGKVIAFGFVPMKDVSKDIEIQLFTGLKDKNGKEIYSGDLLKYENNDKTFEVKWADEGFWECDGSCLGNVLRDLEIKMEVVGNIFEK